MTNKIYKGQDSQGNNRYFINGWELDGATYQGRHEFASYEDAAAWLANWKENDREESKWICS